jgi:hypothetical protein
MSVYAFLDKTSIASQLIGMLRDRVRQRTSGLMGDLDLFEISLRVLVKHTTRQAQVAAWVREAFGDEIARDGIERALRVVEEVVELAQAVGVSAGALHHLIDYVFARPVGEEGQEIGGCFVTLYALAEARQIDADAQFEAELARIQRPEVIARVRRTQEEKRQSFVAVDVAVEK